MKTTFKKTLGVIIALLLVISAALPALALGVRDEPSYPTPEGYDDHDYQKLISFLLTEDEEGVSNVEKLRWLYRYNEIGFDLSDPSTWGQIYFENEEENFVSFSGIIWTNDEVRRLRRIDIEFEGEFGSEQPVPCGDLDLSGCLGFESALILGFDLDSLDVSGCTSLLYLTSLCRGLGGIDVSGCTELLELDLSNHGLPELDITDCTKLTHLQCADENITQLDLSNNPLITWLNLSGNPLEELDVSPCTGLTTLMCGYTDLHELSVADLASLNTLYCPDSELESLDVSGCFGLTSIDCTGNKLTELDLSDCPACGLEHISAEGSGYIGLRIGNFGGPDRATAEPAEGAQFIGWYSEDDELITDALELRISTAGVPNVIARFTQASAPAVPGDANGSGELDATDALLIIRHVMGLIVLPEEVIANCDVDGSGSVDVNDALIVMRIAMGLITEA